MTLLRRWTPEEPPPEDPPPLEGEDVMADEAAAIVEDINEPKAAALNAECPVYQSGGCMAMDSNFSIHLSDTPKT